METIRYSKVYKQDIAFGRGAGEVTLGDGRVVSMDELNLDSFADKIMTSDDSSNSSTSTLQTWKHTTTGTPANGIGLKLLAQVESEDETPSDAGALEWVMDDIGANSEDSSFYIWLRRGGNALSRAYRFLSTGDFLLTLTSTLTAARTWTIPDSTSTFVGTDVTQTLTNKTLTNSLHNAGSGSESFSPDGIIHVDLTSTSTSANTTETNLLVYSLPANSLSANNKGVRIRTWGTTATNANTKTVRLYFGSSVVESNDISTAPNGTTWLLEADVFRTGASTQNAIGRGVCGATSQSASFNLPTEDTTGAITIKVTGQNGTASADDIVYKGISITFLNG